MKLISFRPSPRKHKKFEVIVQDGDTFHTIHFGDDRYEDYTQSHDKQRRELYLARHKSRENWSDPTTAGFWARHVLWGDSINLATNLAAAKRLMQRL